MAPAQSKLVGSKGNKVAERILHHVRSFPPPIAFTKSKKATAKKESSDYREFEMRLDPTDAESQKTKKSVAIQFRTHSG